MVNFLQEYSFLLLNLRVCHKNPKPHQFSYRVTASLQVKGLQRHNSLLRAMGGICLQTLSKQTYAQNFSTNRESNIQIKTPCMQRHSCFI